MPKGDSCTQSPILIHGCTNPRSRKIKGPVRRLVLQRLVGGYGYAEISKEVKRKCKVHVLPTTIQGFAIRHAELLAHLAENELSTILHQGFAEKATRVRALLQQVLDLNEAISGYRSQNRDLHQKWRTDATLSQLFKERRQTLEAIRNEVEPYKATIKHDHRHNVTGEVQVRRVTEKARDLLEDMDDDTKGALLDAIHKAVADEAESNA